MKNEIKFTPRKCGECTQSLEYLLPIDRGTVRVLKGIARAIYDKGINVVHIHKEVMAEGYITANERSNVARPRSHGLIAKVKGEGMKGNYCLTPKGSNFLNGRISVPKYRKISKDKSGNEYFEPEACRVHIRDFDQPGETWESTGYEIEEGRIIRTLPTD